MKLPRRRYWVLLVLVGGVCLGAWCDLHYHVIGWWRGDAYFQGMPTSYWHHAAVYHLHNKTKWMELTDRFVHFRRFDYPSRLALFRGDPKSARVVSQILRDESLDSTVRMTLLHSLCSTAIASEELVAAIRPSLNDANDLIKCFAAQCLLESKSDSALAIHRLMEVLQKWENDPNPTLRRCAMLHIVQVATCHQQLDRRQFLAILDRLAQDSDRDVRDAAAKSVKELAELAH
jgi:DNA alkylation repair enzyme